ncbi:MAG TPA: hypothetical protein VF179_10665 [Thermoanaerobaculia bacterium]|nr:hypothetical protein [Thermoanaerobaculia bacterium]
MHRRNLLFCLLAVLALSLIGMQAQAATVQQLNLAQMVSRAERVFRGTVLTIREGKIDAGGAELPTVTYRIRVDEAFKGTYQDVKGMQIAEITMLGKLKNNQTANTRSLPLIDLPKLQVGQDYLLLTTQPSAIGLSTPVGLGQGAFRVTGKAGQELAVNENHNLGLFKDMGGISSGVVPQNGGGPLPYTALAALIQDLVD